VWNLGLYQDDAQGSAALARTVELRVDGLPAAAYQVRHYRIDRDHSNVQRVWERLGGGDWPTPAQWNTLRAANVLEELPPRTVTVGSTVAVSFELPMPGVSYLELSN
jgi:xylan 1,4-beta-xylosidase